MPHPRLDSLNRSLFHPGLRLSCALSGGADSTALLLALHDANAEKDSLGLVLSAIHIHHGLRGPEADADEAFVRELCAAHRIPLTVRHVDTPAHRQATGEGFEEAARTLRYAAFRDLLDEGRLDAIATAHTRDDQAETVLMKLLRGAWTDGLGGISPILSLSGDTPLASGAPRSAPAAPAALQVLRPLLSTSRAEVEQFLTARGQPWRTDTSNADTTLTRNRIRHEILPVLRTLNPSLDATLARTASLAREDDAFWQQETARVLPGLLLPGKPVRGGGRAVSTAIGERAIAVELDRLKAQPPALRGRLLRAAALSLGCRLDAQETGKLLALAGLPSPELVSAAPFRPGARLELAGGLRAERSARELRLAVTLPVAIPRKM